jgi:hypothetical protein
MTWVPMGLNIRSFKFSNEGGEGFQSDYNWVLTQTQCFEIVADRPCKFWIAALNFNDGFYASYPQGFIYWSMPALYPTGYLEATYAYDPYIARIPDALNKASKKWAGVELLDWLIGKRQMIIAFNLAGDSLTEEPDKETLEATRRRLRQEGFDALASIGFGGYEGSGR